MPIRRCPVFTPCSACRPLRPPSGHPGRRPGGARPASRSAGSPPHRTAPPAEERISTSGEWHIPSRPAASASGGVCVRLHSRFAGRYWQRQHGHGSSGHGSTGHGARGCWDPGCAPRRGRGRRGAGHRGRPDDPPEPLTDAGYRRPSRTRVLAARRGRGHPGHHRRHGHAGRDARPQTVGHAAARAARPAPRPAHGAASGVRPRPRGGPVDFAGPGRPADPAGQQRITGLACPKRVCYVTRQRAACWPSSPPGTGRRPTPTPTAGWSPSPAPPPGSASRSTPTGTPSLKPGQLGRPALVGTGSGTLTSVSCTGPAFCVAVDTIGVGFQYGAPRGLDPAHRRPGGQRLNSVSCASPTDCVAVSSTGNVFTFNGSSWAAGPVDSGHDLVRVSCPRTSFCMAVDSSGQAAEFRGQWTPAHGPGAAAVSCPSTGTCLAVHVPARRPATPAAGGPARRGSRGQHHQLSCAAVNSCVATGPRQRAVLRPPPAGLNRSRGVRGVRGVRGRGAMVDARVDTAAGLAGRRD